MRSRELPRHNVDKDKPEGFIDPIDRNDAHWADLRKAAVNEPNKLKRVRLKLLSRIAGAKGGMAATRGMYALHQAERNPNGFDLLDNKINNDRYRARYEKDREKLNRLAIAKKYKMKMPLKGQEG